MTNTDFADLAADFGHDFTVEEVARVFRVTPQTVMGWCRERGFGYRVGRSWRIPHERLDAIRQARNAARP
jgi:excisionase family DNA binding protein